MLELGGNDPLIVLADADLAEAADLAVRGAFQNSGQRCSAVKRIIAVDTVADELVERIAAGAAALRAGDPLDDATDLGTVIDEAAARRIEGRVGSAVTAGAQLRYGGERAGALLTPAVLDHVRPEMELVALETFGPVAPVIRVGGLDEAIAVANHTPSPSRAASAPSTGARSRAASASRGPGPSTSARFRAGAPEPTRSAGRQQRPGVKEGVREAMCAMSFTKLYTLPWA